jgi:glycerol kinase
MVLQIPVDRPEITETTALGACYLAGLQVGIFSSLDDLRDKWRLERKFEPAIGPDTAEKRYEGWLAAVARVRS